MISLLCPTRGRQKNIDDLRENVLNTVSDQYNIELLIKQDGDSLIELDSRYTFIKSFIGTRSDYLNRDYYNFLAKEAQGDYLFSIGDDVRFITKDWDKILEEKIEAYLKDKPDRIAYISVSERGSQAKHPCFPLITKEAFQTIGMYFHPQLLSWGADRCLYELYSGVNRILHIPEIEIEHLSYHDGKAPRDETANSMRERFFRDPNCHNKISQDIIPNQIEELGNYIKRFNKEK
jgi:hypothetical protein